MQYLKNKSYLESCRELISFYEKVLAIYGRLPWPLRICYSRFQLLLCKRVHKLRKAIQNFCIHGLSGDDKREIIKICKEFEEDQKPEILGLTVDQKFMWGFYGLVAMFVALTLPEATLSKFDMKLLPDLLNGVPSPGYILKLLSPLLSNLDMILASILVLLVTATICRFIFYKINNFLYLYLRHYEKFSSLENFYDVMSKSKSLRNVKAELLSSLPSSLDKLEFAVFKDLPTSPPTSLLQSGVWFFTCLGIFSFLESLGFMLMAIAVLTVNTLSGVEKVNVLVFLFSFFVIFGCVGIHSVLEIIKRRNLIKALGYSFIQVPEFSSRDNS